MNRTLSHPESPSEASLVIAHAKRMIGCVEDDHSVSDHQRVCRCIREHRFCPPVSLQPAIMGLASPELALHDFEFSEKVVADQLQNYCMGFFSLSVEARQKGFQGLATKVSPYPHLKWRLNALMPGLTVGQPKPGENLRSLPLEEDACEVFVMTPAAAAKSLRKTCSEMASSQQKMKEAGNSLRQFKATCAEFAALHPPAALSLLDRYQRLVAPPMRAKSEPSAAGAGSGWSGVVAIAFLFFALIRSGVFDSARPFSPPVVPPPMSSVPYRVSPDANKELFEAISKVSPKLLEQVVGEQKAQQFMELQKKKDDAEKRLKDAKAKLDALKAKDTRAESKGSSREVVTTLDQLKGILDAAAERSADPDRPRSRLARESADAAGSAGSNDTSSPVANLGSLPAGARVFIKLPNGKFIPPQLAQTWINYVENREKMSEEERMRIEKILEEGAVDLPQGLGKAGRKE